MIKELLSIGKISKLQLQKIGSIAIFVIVVSFILFEIFKFITPFLQKELEDNKRELREEIVKEIRTDLDSFANYQREFNEMIIYKLDSISHNISIIICITETQTSTILTLIKNSNLNQVDKMEEIIRLLRNNTNLLKNIGNKNIGNNIEITKE